MKDETDTGEIDLGVFERRRPLSGLTNAEVIALALSALWLLAVTIFFFVAGRPDPELPNDPLRGLAMLLAVFMPVGLIWIGTIAAASARSARRESERLRAALDTMRQAYVAQRQVASTAMQPSVERKLDEIVAAQRQTGATLATFTSVRPHPVDMTPARRMAEAAAAPATAEEQTSLDLTSRGNPVQEPVSISDFVVALNFPETPEDTEGFRALRRAMRDYRSAELLQASQDILTLLSQEGIYMDDMAPDRARPEVWRRFAQGERGRSVAALGGIRDRSGIALTAARMRQDHIFRDAAHHFLRKFDHTFVEFEKYATDAEIVALADTRTARAFMLLGRVAGTFD